MEQGMTLYPGDRAYVFTKNLREEEKDVTFYIMENAVHGDNAFWTTENLNIVDEFIKKHI
jgi:hypothetical protein